MSSAVTRAATQKPTTPATCSSSSRARARRMFDPFVDVPNGRSERVQQIVRVLEGSIQIAAKLVAASLEKVVEHCVTSPVPT